eukprot:TRINITY_DN3387_c1_g1_i1.p1 TRINITY_DN3387_c1_g1~~TRINITY_DN3387_c1_g1_i1.p1  ORF type:complete len:587 (-),score=127.63 TRINITY_DN3387_c1_g1_i1:28-1788(-)
MEDISRMSTEIGASAPPPPFTPILTCSGGCGIFAYYMVPVVTMPLPEFLAGVISCLSLVAYLILANRRLSNTEASFSSHRSTLPSFSKHNNTLSFKSGEEKTPLNSFYYLYLQLLTMLYITTFVVLGFFQTWGPTSLVVLPILICLIEAAKLWIVMMMFMKDFSRRSKIISLSVSLFVGLLQLASFLVAQHVKKISIFSLSCNQMFAAFWITISSLWCLLFVCILFLSYSPYRSLFYVRTPVRYYVIFHLTMTILMIISCVLLYNQVDAGLCLYMITRIVTLLCFPSVLYWTFNKDSEFLDSFDNWEITKPLLRHSTYNFIRQLDRWVIPYAELELGERIGVGGFGEVYFAYWNGVAVAVKKLFFKNLSEKDELEFKAEIEIMSKLNHKNVLKLLGVCLEKPNMAIITEYVPRGNLQDLLKSNSNLEWSLILRMAGDIALGMSYLHTLSPPLIHRDLKTANILVGDNYQIRVCDFGIARFRDEKTMTAVGTISCAAPEVLRGERYTESCDVYSYGIILWELKTRESPYEGKSHFEVLNLVVSHGSRPPLPKDCSPSFLNLMQTCWSNDPRERPPFTQIVSDWDKIS